LRPGLRVPKPPSGDGGGVDCPAVCWSKTEVQWLAAQMMSERAQNLGHYKEVHLIRPSPTFRPPGRKIKVGMKDCRPVAKILGESFEDRHEARKILQRQGTTGR
jgi:hypothetical protein